VKILCYHKIQNIKNFERQVLFLKDHYEVIGPQEVLNCLENKSEFNQNKLLLTFYKGDFTLVTNVLPILERLKIQALAFVVTGLVGTKLPFWWDEVIFHGYDQATVTY
jgi:peptidoglycan/xylan/chitin deacetylase (PgdA/CDA1 family)